MCIRDRGHCDHNCPAVLEYDSECARIVTFDVVGVKHLGGNIPRDGESVRRRYAQAVHEGVCEWVAQSSIAHRDSIQEASARPGSTRIVGGTPGPGACRRDHRDLAEYLVLQQVMDLVQGGRAQRLKSDLAQLSCARG